MFKHLMNEVEAVRRHDPELGILEAIMFINEYKDEYDDKVKNELRIFLIQGACMMATV
jgi:hypothetical protein